MSHENGNGHGNGRLALPFNRGVAAGDRAEDLLPPHSHEAERSVLGGLLLDPSQFDAACEEVGPEDFYRAGHEAVFRVMRYLHAEGRPIDAVTLADELIRRGQYAALGGDEFLRGLADGVPHAVNLLYHARIVRQKAISRGLIQGATEIIRDGYANLYTVPQLVDSAYRKLEALIEGRGLGDSAAGEDDGIRDFPAPPGPAAYHGVLGQAVREIEPYTEASAPAMLLQLLVGFGNMVGAGPHWVHEANRHRLNLYLCLVGNTADGRKGTSWGYPRRILTAVDPGWAERIIPGINSGPALIEQVADEETTRTGSFLRGVTDKRILMYESEFTRLLAIFSRDSETLGMVLRQAWEDDRLAAISKKNPVRASGAHASCIAHVTHDDLHASLRLTDVANGLGNRFLWACTRSSKRLDEEVRFRWERLDPHIEELRLSLDFARRDVGLDPTPMGRSPSAQRFWKERLEVLRKPRPGLLGAILARGPAQVMRLAAIYALVDRQKQISVPHLEAALELWSYCVRSIDFIFGDRLGDPDAERILAALEAAGPAGLPRHKLHKALGNNRDVDALNALLRRMVRSGLIRRESGPARGGRPAEIWHLDRPAAAPPPPDVPAELPAESAGGHVSNGHFDRPF